MVVTAVYCLMIAHPGMVFKNSGSELSPRETDNEGSQHKV